MTEQVKSSPPSEAEQFDPVLLAVMANRITGVCRQMTNTLLRAGRSSALALARDFSCSVVTANNALLESAEGLPVHVMGSRLLSEAMTELHPDLAEGDAFLHNDPYLGNTHHGDHSILVPVFWEGEHVFTACAIAHQADVGNSLPTTYMPTAKDIYEEGALNFPCVRIQEGYQDVDDIIRMCRRRIRLPHVWYGDYLAALGAARVGERALKDFISKYGLATVRAFVREWLDYSERRMIMALQDLSSQEWTAVTTHDEYPGLPKGGMQLRVQVAIDAEAGSVSFDLRDNPDTVPAGINQSKTTAISNVMIGLFNSIDSSIPHNSGSYRRVNVELREGCVVGIPIHPTSCSMSTSSIADRMINLTQASFAEANEGLGLAEGCVGFPPSHGVVSGVDRRFSGEAWQTQPFLGAGGGPGGPEHDGWITYLVPVAAGLIYRDSVEVDEQKYPIMVRTSRVRPDSEGAGRRRGAPGNQCEYGPLWDPMMCFYSLDGSVSPPNGVRGGGSPLSPSVYRVLPDDSIQELPEIIGEQQIKAREMIGSRSAGGAGYGDPFTREPDLVLRDVIEGYVSRERAEQAYGVAIAGDPSRAETLTVDKDATRVLRGGRVDVA